MSAKFLLSSIDCQPVENVPLTLFAVITLSDRRLVYRDYWMTRGMHFRHRSFEKLSGNDCFTSSQNEDGLDHSSKAENILGGLSDVR